MLYWVPLTAVHYWVPLTAMHYWVPPTVMLSWVPQTAMFRMCIRASPPPSLPNHHVKVLKPCTEMDPVEKDVDVRNYIRLLNLLNTVANNFIRAWFSKLWKDSENSEWTNTLENGKKFIDNAGRKLYRSSQDIQKKYLETGNINVWDLPLLVNAVSCILPGASETFGKDFENLKKCRNKLAHLGNLEIKDEEFNTFWEDISTILLSLGIKQDELDKAGGFKVQSDSDANLGPAIDPKAEELKNNGNKLFKQEQYAKAIENYSKAILLPDIPTSYLAILYANRSIAYLKTGDLQNAKDDAKGVIHMRPNWWKGYVRLAMFYDRMKKYDKALNYYDIALGFEPDALDIRNGRDSCRNMIAKRKREEHMDPLSHVQTFQDCADLINKSGGELTSAAHLEALQKLDYQRGDSFGFCGEGHNYFHGRGVTQNYEMAATMYAKAAGTGNAEGLYNLALLTLEGKGVNINIDQAMQMFFKAAEQEPFTEQCGIMRPNIGVMEAQHSLGLSYELGVGMRQDYQKAMAWYEKALVNNNGCSGNNLAIMYLNGKGVQRDVNNYFLYSQVASLKGTVRAMENIANNYLKIRSDLKTAQKWYTIVVKNGSVSLPLRKEQFRLDEFPMDDFNCEEFLDNLKQELLQTPMKRFFLNDYKRVDKWRSSRLEKKETDTLSNEFRTRIIIEHREHVKELTSSVCYRLPMYTATPKLQHKDLPDLIGLKPIFFREMNQREDHIYEGFALKLTLIEDAPLCIPSIPLIGQDDNGDVHRIFAYNYPQTKETQESLSYGTRITIVNPYFRITSDCKPAIRVDDPTFVFINKLGKNPNMCRYCGKPQGTVPCRTCRRVYYCSDLCLKKDSEILQHSLICMKRL